MNLPARDFVATQALYCQFLNPANLYLSDEQMAKKAYKLADAMLEASKKKPKKVRK